jgi:Raf kinase inhibitor-like YbhB/YbcL family protein
MSLTISAPAFASGTRMPTQFSRNGGNVSPELQWQGAPRDTRSFALVIEDPDAPKGTFHHWGVYNIPPTTLRLAQGATLQTIPPTGTVKMARNDFGNHAYDGPQPPAGGEHHYHFRLLALDVPSLDVPSDCDVSYLLDEARAHALAEAEVVGTFQK